MKSPFPRAVYQKNAQIYRVLSNPIRLEILNVLREQPASVDDLTNHLRLRKANISQHLALLRQSKLVTRQRDGLRVIYKIVDPLIVEPCRILLEIWSKNL